MSVGEAVSGVGEERSVSYSTCNMECFGVFVVCDDCDLCLPRAGYSDELWRLSLVTLEWTLIELSPHSARPSGRYRHTMTVVGRDLWLHGGSGEDHESVTRAARLLVLH